MSKFLNVLTASAVALAVATPVVAGQFGLGRTAEPDEIAAWDIDVRPDGLGLPAGSGSVMDGEEIFSEKCAVCHGDFGEAVGRWPVLAGGQGTLKDDRPVKTIGSYWPYLSTVWDYVHRAMPFGDAQSLEPDEVYAIVAYLMYVNDLVEDDFVLSQANFAEQKMPNEAHFFMDDRAVAGGELATFAGEVCMQDCKPKVEITSKAAIVDVTPEDAEARRAREAKYATEGTTESTGEAPAAQEPEAGAPVEDPAAEQEAAAPAAALDPELVAAGEKVFKKCKACHQVGEGAKNKTGPILNGVVGRHLAAVDGFKYSNDIKAMGDEGQLWDEATLAAFLAKPKAVIPKTRMSFAGLKSEDDIRAVTEYLKSFAD
jgi:cytochrome c